MDYTTDLADNLKDTVVKFHFRSEVPVEVFAGPICPGTSH